jgi:hypothetical protein
VFLLAPLLLVLPIIVRVGFESMVARTARESCVEMGTKAAKGVAYNIEQSRQIRQVVMILLTPMLPYAALALVEMCSKGWSVV